MTQGILESLTGFQKTKPNEQQQQQRKKKHKPPLF